jgi:hypothetical protein
MASRDPGKVKVRELSRLQPEFHDVIAVVEYFGTGEHPVAAAIVGSVSVEHHLEKLLRSRFKRTDDQTWKMLMEDEPRPLNSFYSKIVVGYALGIYDLGMRNDLNIVRNIRNAFAHSPKQIKFDHPTIVNELKKATRSALPKAAWKGLKAQDCYVRLCVSLSLKLSRIRIRRSKGLSKISQQQLIALVQAQRAKLEATNAGKVRKLKPSIPTPSEFWVPRSK